MAELTEYFSDSYINLRSVLICSVIFLCLSWYLRKPRKLPPGPWSVPILGSLPYLALKMYRSSRQPPERLFQAMSRQYGNVFSFNVLGYNVVVLNSYEAVKEAFQNPVLNDRPHNWMLEEINIEPGVVMANGESWKRQRRFTLSTLRGFGVGKKSFEEQISTETMALLKEFKKLSHQPFDPRHLLGNAVSNVICAVIFGHRFDYDDDEFKKLLFIMYEQFRLIGSGALHVFFPQMKYLQPQKSKQVQEIMSRLIESIKKIIDEHREQFDPNNPRDFIDVYLTETADTSIQSHFNERTFINTIQTLFTAGSETTATTLRWALLYMMAYPDIQRRVQQELDTVVGGKRRPKLSDIPNLPFIGATLLEVQRIATIAPLGVFHRAANDTSLRGFSIPKGSLLLPNLWAIHHDPNLWKEPSEFNPTRFLDTSGNIIQKPELIPFSTGKRICLGENLAKMELFLFFTHMLHQFTFKKPTDSADISLRGISGIVHQPQPFDLVISSRINN